MKNERTVAITRLFDAPREPVFAAWARKGWAQTVARLDAHLKPGS